MATRILVSLGEERVEQLDRLARSGGHSRAALIRKAVDDLLERQSGASEKARRDAALEAGFGA